MIDHDRLFKELLSTFFVEFIELFFPDVMAYLEPESVTFPNLEVFTDVTAGERYETDLLAQARFKGQESYFLVHVENQSTPDTNFNRRMFRYFARLHEKFALPIYPVVVFSYNLPKKPAESRYQVEFPDFKVLEFNYRVIQLNRLNWRDFLNQQNPVASALMVKMQIAPEDRPKVKTECLRLLVTLRLDPARTQLISGFIDTYLRLTEPEQERFQAELGRIEPDEREEVMQIVTSWMEQGIQQGRQELVLRQLKRKIGFLEPNVEEQISGLTIDQLDELGIALLDFSNADDLTTWLRNLEQSNQETN